MDVTRISLNHYLILDKYRVRLYIINVRKKKSKNEKHANKSIFSKMLEKLVDHCLY